MSRHGFVPLQIMTGKSISFPGLESRVEETEVSEHIMEMLKARKAFSENEFKRRIKEAGKRVVSKYMDKVYEPGDKILFQDKDEKTWRPGVVKDSRSNEIKVEVDGVEKRVHPNRVQKFHNDVGEDLVLNKSKDEGDDAENDDEKKEKRMDQLLEANPK